MSDRTAYAHGMPNWVDVAVPDVEAAGRFYHALFGWELGPDMGPESGGYRIFTLRGLEVAGIGPEMGPPVPAWVTYIKVDDIDATLSKVTEQGGQVVFGPMDLPMGAGRIAVVADTVGAVVALMQPGAHIGARVVNEPGALTWNELTTREPDTAAAFWSAVLGIAVEEQEMMAGYKMFLVDGEGVAGIMPMHGEGWPEDLPSHWMAYFAVADCAASAARCTELGGAVMVPPTDIPIGRFAVLNDPFGKVFSVFQPAPEPQSPA